MIALVKTKEGPGNLSLLEVPEPKAKRGEVKVKVVAVGICGTDIKIYRGTTWSNPPVIVGHEFSGIVEEVGEGVTKVKPGDKVVSETAQVVCGDCYFCNTGNQLMCPERLSLGYGVDGTMAKYCVVRDGIIHKLPETINLDEAALFEPCAVAVHAVYDSAQLYPTDLAVVMGPGPIGLILSQVVKAFGCTVVLVGTEKDKARLDIGKKLGIDYVVNIEQEDLNGKIKELTKGRGADIVYDCSGSSSAINSGLNVLKKMGKLVQIGLTQQNLNIDYGLLCQNQISIIGTFGHTWNSWDKTIQLVENKKIKLDDLISHRYKLEEWEKAFDNAEKQEGIKLLLYP